ncbi:hypothetical protein F5Y17DRAFT_10811 [Xylariaceae sp. FL0594]|nr:hypothetical protein F5Y17DRAFT_10811 [Xylariaceae sp. FL0594]
MCVQTYEHYTKCDHVSSTLTPCPTHYKEQKSSSSSSSSSGGGFLSCLFGSSRKKKPRHRTNCGRVVPYHLTNETYCQSCSVRTSHLRASGVGQGALRVHQQDEGLREERKRAAKASLEKSEHKNKAKGAGGSGSGSRSNHEVLHVQSSVWLQDLYHNPEALAKKEAYARQAAAAPPISSRLPHQSSSTGPRTMESSRFREYDSRRQESSSRSRRTEESDRDRSSRAPTAYGSSQPVRRPAPPPAATYTYQSPPQHSGYPTHPRDGPYLPPAVGRPPVPQKSHLQQQQRQQQQQQQYRHQPHLPSAPPPRPPHHNYDYAPAPAPPVPPKQQQHQHQHQQHPELRHKTGRVYNSNKSRNPPTKPAYREYLDAMETQAAMDRMREARERKVREAMDRVHPYGGLRRDDEAKPHHHHHQHGSGFGSGSGGGSSGWLKKKIGISDSDSNISFVCKDSRAISGDKNRSGSSRRRSRK